MKVRSCFQKIMATSQTNVIIYIYSFVITRTCILEEPKHTHRNQSPEEMTASSEERQFWLISHQKTGTVSITKENTS